MECQWLVVCHPLLLPAVHFRLLFVHFGRVPALVTNTRALRKEQPQNNSSTMSSLLFGGNDSRSFPEVIEKFVSTPTSTDDNQQTESLNYILFGAYDSCGVLSVAW